MAENLCFEIEDAIISSDEENVKPKRKMVSSSTSDSESDCGANAKPLKKRSTRTFRRGVLTSGDTQPLALYDGPKIKTSSLFSSVYSQAITETFPLRSHKIDPSISASLSDNDSDDEIDDILEKKATAKKTKASKGTKSRSSTVAASRKGSRNRRRSSSPEVVSVKESGSDQIKEYKPTIVFLEDEETDVSDSDTESRGVSNNSLLSISQTREPTPPPSPSEEGLVSQKPKRRKKAIKTAISKLENAKRDHEILKQVDEDDDGDISILEVSTPTAASDRTLMTKIRSRSGIQRFPMKMGQSFADIFKEMAGHEFVNESQISMFVGDRRINTYDTPANLDLKVADIIDCYIRKTQEVAEESSDEDSNDPNLIKLRVQGKDSKSQVTLSLNREEPMEKLMRQYAKKKSLNYDTLNFQFDGEDINPRDTPSTLDLEDSFCIDVINSL